MGRWQCKQHDIFARLEELNEDKESMLSNDNPS